MLDSDFQNAMQRYDKLHRVTFEAQRRSEGADRGVGVKADALEVDLLK